MFNLEGAERAAMVFFVANAMRIPSAFHYYH